MRRATGFAWTVVVLAGLAGSTAARAQDEGEAGDTAEVGRDIGPLRDRIKPVSGHVFLMKGRLEFSPAFTLSLRDAFYQKYIFGAGLTYHLTDVLGFGIRGDYAIPVIAGTAQICAKDSNGVLSCGPPTDAQLDGKAPGKISLLGSADVEWSPLYGKLSLLAEQFLHFNMYGVAGLGAVQYAAPPTTGTTSVPELALGLNLGAGFRFFINRFLTARFELRDLFYSEVVQPRPDHQLRSQLMFEAGVTMFFPPNFTQDK